jgi:hypothetical protein
VGQPGAGSDEVLAVIEDQEEALGTQVSRESLCDRLLGMLLDPERRRDGRGDELGIDQGSQLDQPDPIGIGVQEVVHHPQRQAGLAAAASPGQRQQPGRGQQALDLGNLLLSSDEAGEERREVREV